MTEEKVVRIKVCRMNECMHESGLVASGSRITNRGTGIREFFSKTECIGRRYMRFEGKDTFSDLAI